MIDVSYKHTYLYLFINFCFLSFIGYCIYNMKMPKNRKSLFHNNTDKNYLFLNTLITKKIDCHNTTFYCSSKDDCNDFCDKSLIPSRWECSDLNVCEKTRNQIAADGDREHNDKMLYSFFINIEKIKYFLHIPERVSKLPHLVESIHMKDRIKKTICKKGSMDLHALLQIEDSKSLLDSCNCNKSNTKYTFMNTFSIEPRCLTNLDVNFLYYDINLANQYKNDY
ncbi:MAG: per os infectivity factor pif-3 [Cotesia congregata filamentous virus 2]